MIKFMSNFFSTYQTKYENWWENFQEKPSFRKGGWLIFLMIIFFCVLMATAPVRNVMEARNFKTASEMLERGEWAFPTLNGQPRVEKPPLPTWAVAILAKFAGERNIFFMRVPNMLMGLAMLFAFFIFVKNLYNIRTAIFSSLILASSGQFFGEIMVARWDMFSTSFGIMGILSIVKMLQTKKIIWVLSAIICWSGAYWSKGPIAIFMILIPFLLTIVFSQWLEKHKYFIENSQENCQDTSFSNLRIQSWDWERIANIIIYSTIIGSLFLLWIKLAYPNALQTLYQDVKDVQSIHSETFWFYFYQSPILIAPWTLLFVSISVWIGHNIYQRLRYKISLAFSKTIIITIFWCFLTFLLLSLTPAKKNRYFFPALPITCLVLGVIWDHILAHSSHLQLPYFRGFVNLQEGLITLAWILFPLAIIFFIIFYHINFWYLSIIFLWILLFPIFWKKSWIKKIFTFLSNKHEVNIKVASQTILSLCLITFFSVSILFFVLKETPLWRDPYLNIYPQVKNITEKKQLYLMDFDDDLLWGIGRNVKKIYKIEDLLELLKSQNSKENYYILIQERNQQELFNTFPNRKITLRYEFQEHAGKKAKKWILYEMQ